MKKLLIIIVTVLGIAGIFVTFIKKPESKNSLAFLQMQEEAMASINLPSVTVSDYRNTSYAPLSIDNQSEFASGWSLQSDDGVASSTSEYDSVSVNVLSVGTKPDSIIFYRDGLPLINGNTYTISFDSTIDTTHDINVAILNANTQYVISSNTFTLTDTNTYSFTFKMTEKTTWNGRLAIQLGKDNSTTDAYNIEIKNLRIVSDINNNQTIRVNQIGYYPSEVKRCVFSYDAGDFFDVVDASNNQVVYTGAILREIDNDSTGETNYYGDYSNVTTEGTYYIRAQIPTTSFKFTIDSHVYDDLLNSLTNMLYAQRCGSELSASRIGNLSHGICHDSLATVFNTDITMDVSGGWHDAGDYGRYVKTGTKAVNDLLLASLTNPSYANNADLLDEAKYELDWLFKMQNSSDGAVYSKVMTKSFPGDILPVQDNQPLYIFEIESGAVGDFALTMSIAYLSFKDIDVQYANKCLEAAKKAYEYLQNNPETVDYPNPEGITGGNYTDSIDDDERFAAALSLYVATGEDNYLQDAKARFEANNDAANGVGWHDVGGYARYIYLISTNTDKNDEFYTLMKSSLVEEANKLVEVAHSDGYFNSLVSYNWGSNGDVANNANLLMMAYFITGDRQYREVAGEQLNYLLGTNSLNMSFVTGYGTRSPKYIHSRVARVLGIQLKGALVGGPDSSREDDVSENISDSVPPAKVYADTYGSYSTNEIAIYWNSSLIYLLLQLSN